MPTPEAVAPGVVYLASADCHDSGYILRASNGQFHATRSTEAEGVAYPRVLRAVRAGSIEDIAGQWPAIAPTVAEPR